MGGEIRNLGETWLLEHVVSNFHGFRKNGNWQIKKQVNHQKTYMIQSYIIILRAWMNPFLQEQTIQNIVYTIKFSKARWICN